MTDPKLEALVEAWEVEAKSIFTRRSPIRKTLMSCAEALRTALAALEPSPEPSESAEEVARKVCAPFYSAEPRGIVKADLESDFAQALTDYRAAGVREAFADGAKYTNASERAMFYWECITNKPHKGPRFIDDAIAAGVREERERVQGLISVMLVEYGKHQMEWHVAALETVLASLSPTPGGSDDE